MIMAEIIGAIGLGACLGTAVVWCAPAETRNRETEPWRSKDAAGNAGEETGTDIEKILAGVAVEGWKMMRAAMQAQHMLDERSAKRLKSRVKWFKQKTHRALENEGVRVVDPTGQDYDEGMAVTASNAEDYDASTMLSIDDTLEPIVVGSHGRILHTGLVMVKEKTQ